MPRSRGSEIPLRQSPRAPLQTRSSGSVSDPLHQRPTVDRSPKMGDRRSPRGTQSEPVNQKKLGTRIADLESQLGQAQEELKKLKDQLASAEAAKREVQDELEKKTHKLSIQEENTPILLPSPTEEIHEYNENFSTNPEEFFEENLKETDVFEVPQDPILSQPKQELTEEEEDGETKQMEEMEVNVPSLKENDPIYAELDFLKVKLEEKEKEVEVLHEENESLKGQVEAGRAEVASARAKEEETLLKLSQMEVELEASKANEAVLKEKIEGIEGEKMEMEIEMKKMRVQTEQWRKAADAAAIILAGGMEINGRKVGERCGSMDKHFGGNSGFESGGGYPTFVGSPITDELDDGFGNGKRKGSGIRMFGDLWKKKGQK